MNSVCLVFALPAGGTLCRASGPRAGRRVFVLGASAPSYRVWRACRPWARLAERAGVSVNGLASALSRFDCFVAYRLCRPVGPRVFFARVTGALRPRPPLGIGPSGQAGRP